MAPDNDKNIERLARAVETVINTPWKTFWRGFIWGLGRGLGATVGLAIVLGVGFYILNQTGIIENFADVFNTIEQGIDTLDSFRP